MAGAWLMHLHTLTSIAIPENSSSSPNHAYSIHLRAAAVTCSHTVLRMPHVAFSAAGSRPRCLCPFFQPKSILWSEGPQRVSQEKVVSMEPTEHGLTTD